MKRRLFAMTTILLSLIGAAACGSGGSPRLAVKAPRLVGSGDVAIFMVIRNSGESDDYLTGASLKEYPTARGEIHDVINGAMTPVDRAKVPAGGFVSLERGSKHLMFFGLPDDPGDKVTIVLRFEKSGAVEVSVPVRR